MKISKCFLMLIFSFTYLNNIALSELIEFTGDPVIKTHSGYLRGIKKIPLGADSDAVDAFLGIPFAKPPLNDLRFKKPVHNEPWKGILDTTHLPNSCYQEMSNTFSGFVGEEMWNPKTPISEDCLYLNLWVPSKLRQSGNATVLVWIHGGGYVSGSATLDIYDGSILAAANDVIVVSINYRLGPFGFLYLGTEEAPGNVGLFDQALAIKWVNDNIAFFGGNPESVTLFGSSAGAGSVSLHLLSPVSRNFTRRAILQSGSINAPWSYMSAENSKNKSLKLASLVDCNKTSDLDLDVESLSVLMDCLRSVDASVLSKSQWNLPSVILGIPFSPTIDGDFLPKNPEEMLREGGYPKSEILVGSTKDEGTLFLLYDFLQFFDKDVPALLSPENFRSIIASTFPDLSQLEILAITLQYNDWDHILTGNDSVLSERSAELFSDYAMTCPLNRFAEKSAEQGSDVYYYHFTHRSSSNPWGKWMGVMHGDEIEYAFGRPLNPSFNFTQNERELSRRIMTYFTTFAKTGKPELETFWPKYSSQEPRYLILNGEVSGLGHGPRAMQCAFWKHLPLLKEGNC